MSDLRRKPGNTIAEQQPHTDMVPHKRRCYHAAKRFGLAAAILIPAGMVSYAAHLTHERIEAEATVIQLQFAQEVLIDELDILAKRIQDQNSQIAISKQDIAASRRLYDFLESDNQALRDEIKTLSKKETSDKAPERHEPPAAADLVKTLAEKNAIYNELRAENARLRVRMLELVNAMAERQAAANEKTAELGQPRSGT